MKKTALIVLLCLLSAFSCKKDEVYVDPILKEVEYTGSIPQSGLTFNIPFGYRRVTRSTEYFKGYRYRVIAGGEIGPVTLGTPVMAAGGSKYYQKVTVTPNNTTSVRKVTVEFALENGYTTEGGTFGAEGWGSWVVVFSTIQAGRSE